MPARESTSHSEVYVPLAATCDDDDTPCKAHDSLSALPNPPPIDANTATKEIRQNVRTVSHPRRTQRRHRTRPLVPLGPHVPLLLEVSGCGLTPSGLCATTSVIPSIQPVFKVTSAASTISCTNASRNSVGTNSWIAEPEGICERKNVATAQSNSSGEMVARGGSMGRAARRAAKDSGLGEDAGHSGGAHLGVDWNDGRMLGLGGGSFVANSGGRRDGLNGNCQ
jgi:hypothetical protein